MAVCEVSFVPVGTGDTSVSGYVAKCEKVLSETSLKFSLNPMGTVIEGDLEEIFKAVLKMENSLFEKGAKRVYGVIKIDDRKDKKQTMEQKVKSVEEKLNPGNGPLI